MRYRPGCAVCAGWLRGPMTRMNKLAREAVGVVAQQPGTLAEPRILLSGIVPPLADAFYPRPETGPDLANTVAPGQAVVLTHGGESDSAPAAQGGTGKTQLAVEFAHNLWNGKLIEVLVWVTASHREQVVTGFAQAANTVDASNPGEEAEAAAARFISWGAHPAAVGAIIDDLADVADLDDLWPTARQGGS